MKLFWSAVMFFGAGWLFGAWLEREPPTIVVSQCPTEVVNDPRIDFILDALADYEESLTHAMIADQKQDANCHAVRNELRQQVGQFDQSLLEIHELLENQQ